VRLCEATPPDERLGYIGVTGSERALAYCRSALEERLGLRSPLIGVDARESVETARHVGMIAPERAFLNRQRALEEPPRFIVSALLQIEPRQAAEPLCYVLVARPVRMLADFKGTLLERSCLRVVPPKPVEFCAVV